MANQVSRTKARRSVRVAALIAAGLTIASVALAGASVRKPTGVSVGIKGARIISASGNVSPAGNKIRGDLEIRFTCGSKDVKRVSANGAYLGHQSARYHGRTSRNHTFKNVTFATTADLQQACLDGKRTFDAEFETSLVCKSTFTLRSFHDKTVKVPIRLTCRDVISPKERVARVSVRDWKHTCPPGYVHASTNRTGTIVSASNTLRCVRP